MGPENIDELFLLRKADQAGMCNRPASPLALDAFRRHIDRVLADAAALTVHDLAINGNDIKRELALDEGVYIGKILDFLLESVLDDPALNTHARLLEMARKFYEQRLKPFLG
ncbi:MAG: hypothetical protein P8107_11285 [Spirochaetia bacterium]